MVAVAKALEGMEHESIFGSKIVMRAKDHQAIQDVHIMAHTDEGITFDLDNFRLWVEGGKHSEDGRRRQRHHVQDEAALTGAPQGLSSLAGESGAAAIIA